MIKLGFIGFGEAAFNMANGPKGEGLKGIPPADFHEIFDALNKKETEA